jgi:hypothetical protein
MERQTLTSTARTAADGGPAAMTAFREIAKLAGYRGQRGGWICRDGKTICQGWAALAELVATDKTHTDAMLAGATR